MLAECHPLWPRGLGCAGSGIDTPVPAADVPANVPICRPTLGSGGGAFDTDSRDRLLAGRHRSGVSVLERDLDALRSDLGRDPLTRRVERDSDALRASHGRDAGAPANRAARLDAGVSAREVVEL